MTHPRDTRREFLTGSSAARALGRLADGPQHGAAPGAPTRGCTLTLTRRLMACDFEVSLAADRNHNDTGPAVEALDLVSDLEDLLTIYRPGGETDRLNQQAHAGPVPVSPALFSLLALCEELHHQTGGAFDPTSTPLSKAWGFYERSGRVPSDAELDEARGLVGWRHVEIDHAAQTLRFLRPGVGVNFNAIGKGWALDRAADLLTGLGVESFLLHGGRSTLVARGDAPGGGGAGWRVGVRNPLRPAERLLEVPLRCRAFSTSGSAVQGFVAQGVRYGHVLDPRTGRPAVGPLSVSVVAPTGAEADALSTAFYVLGPEASAEVCARRPGVAALFVLPGRGRGSVDALVVPPGGEQLLGGAHPESPLPGASG